MATFGCSVRSPRALSTREQDVDLPFDMGTPMGLLELGELERGLSELPTAPVDLIPFAALRADRRAGVLAEAVPL